MLIRLLLRQAKLLGFISMATVSHAATVDDLLKDYAAEAKKSDASFKQFEAAKGKDFYFAEHKTPEGKTTSCAECHTKDPTKQGKARTGKVVDPMAPSANPKRFTDKAKVEKWFKRNCNDVLARPCTALEKGHFIKFLQSL